MPLEGVRCTLHQVMAKSDSDLRSRGRHLCIEPLRLFPTPELCRAVQSPVEAFDRDLSVEFDQRFRQSDRCLACGQGESELRTRRESADTRSFFPRLTLASDLQQPVRNLPAQYVQQP